MHLSWEYSLGPKPENCNEIQTFRFLLTQSTTIPTLNFTNKLLKIESLFQLNMKIKTRNSHFQFCLSVTAAQRSFLYKDVTRMKRKHYIQKMRTKGIF